MALTGQLSDMSLAELIEFFCNQRKTGRLKVDYHRGHGVFFIKDGELVDAKVGALSGAEAVYFALTLPNAAFDFSSDIEPPRRTIKESWTQVVLEGLRRLDEGQSPSEGDAFGSNWTPSEADMAVFMDHVERLGASAAAAGTRASKEKVNEAAPLSMMVEGASSEGGGKKKMVVFGALAAVVLACAVAAIPLAGRLGSRPSASNASAPAPVAQPETASQPAPENNSTPAEASVSSDSAPAEAAQPSETTVDPAAAAAVAARREREARERVAREREARERERKAEETKKDEDAAKPQTAATTPAPAAAGPKSVRVSVAYDENGRVTQASVAGASPGAEAYGGTAVRIARGRRFPAGKAGATVITIPVN